MTEVRDDPRKPVRSAVVAIGTSGALFEAPLPCPDPENLSFELRSDLEPAVLLRQGIGSHVHPRRIPKALQTQLADAMRTDGRPASKGVALDSDGGVLLGFEDGTAKWIRYWASSDALQAALSDQRTLVRMMEKRQPGISIGLESTPADTSPITSVGELDPLYDISGVYKWRLPSRAVFQLFSLPERRNDIERPCRWIVGSIRIARRKREGEDP